MKLYIATTSLNFDAIVSTDSVSPASFYQQRGFGITLFYDKASFVLPNSILLTDAFPIFSINRSDVDHRPMVIEIDTLDCPDYFEAVKKNIDHTVYRTERTIYITPATSKIFFFSEADKSATLAKAESILESKYLLYVRLGSIKVYDRSMTSIRISQDSFKNISDAPVPDSRFITKDIGINKAKGFIVSYLIGANMAVTPEYARLLRLSKDIKNGIYSLSTKEGKTDDAINSVYILANEAEELSTFLDVRKKEARNRVLRYLSSQDASSMLRGSSNEEIVLFLEKIGVYSSLFSRINGNRLTSIVGLVQQALSSRDDTLTESTLADISRYVGSIFHRSSARQSVPDLFKLGLDRNYIECTDSSLTAESKKKVEIMFNLYSGFSYKASGIRENRVEYVIDAGREFFQETSDGDQEERNYINAMLDNLEHAASFDIMATSSQALQSLAVFMRSPDADLDKMASLIVSSEIPDARIAFGLWGLFYGYSNIPQSYYNSLVQGLNKKETIAFVSQIHDALFGIMESHSKEESIPQRGKSIIQKALSYIGLGEKEELSNSDEVDDLPPDDLPEGDIPVSSNANGLFDSTTSSGQNESSEAVIVEENKGEKIAGSTLHKYSTLWEFCVRTVEASSVKKKDEFVKHYSDQIDHIFETQQSLATIKNGLKEIPSPRGMKDAWGKCLKVITHQIEEIERNETYERVRMEMASQPTLWESIIDDASAANFVELILEGSPIKAHVLANFKHIQKEYQPGGFYSKRNDSRENSNVIDHFEKWCFSDKNSFKRIQRTPENESMVRKIIDFLKKRYPNF